MKIETILVDREKCVKADLTRSVNIDLISMPSLLYDVSVDASRHPAYYTALMQV